MPDPAPRRGALITVEGIDGTGKSSVVAELGRWLASSGVKAAVQREPTASWLGDAVRRSHTLGSDPLTHTFLFVADRAAHTGSMRAQIALGTVVLCDRYFDSTVAYQGAALHDSFAAAGLDSVQWLRTLHDPWVAQPDLTLLLADDPAACVERVKATRGHTAIFEEAPFLAKVQANYRRLALAEPARFRLLEGGDLADLKVRSRALVATFLKGRQLLPEPA